MSENNTQQYNEKIQGMADKLLSIRETDPEKFQLIVDKMFDTIELNNLRKFKADIEKLAQPVSNQTENME
jgi:hypothetical protein